MQFSWTLPGLFLGLATAGAQDGLTLYQPFTGTTAYLIDDTGTVVESWPNTATPGLSVYMLPDGDVMRTRNIAVGGAGTGGGLERVSYDGTVEWSFSFFTSTLIPHHDIEVLPNGNVLLIAWEELGGAKAIAEGRNPATTGSTFAPDTVYEIMPTGPTTGTVVWEWHSIDHVVQEFDAGKPNFGQISAHPELIDINYGPSGDWLHFNGIDYNADLDQIAISVPNFDEIWIIDHSTTTAEAAGHTGGNSGKGGDLLYRYGNPMTYGRGTPADQVLYFNHDVQWIEEGLPGAGNLMVFNNGQGRPTGDWSSVDEWAPPVDAQGNYILAPGMAYGPDQLSWTYSDPGNFYSAIMSGCERLEDGNTLICEATAGRLFEVTPSGTTVWNYVNPFGGPNWVFKARRYSDCDDDLVFDGHEIAIGAEPDANMNGKIDTCEVPVNYCDAATNSTGQAASMGWAGSTSLASNDLDLSASNCPAGNPGIFVFGLSTSSMPFGDGVLCVAPPIGRLGVVQTSAGGVANLDFDATALPASAPPLNPGDTWYFSFWFRDNAGGPAGFNFSDGLSTLFVN